MSYACQRELFDLPDGLTYFNTASQSPCLNTSFSAGERGLRRKLHPWSADRAALPGEMEHRAAPAAANTSAVCGEMPPRGGLCARGKCG